LALAFADLIVQLQCVPDAAETAEAAAASHGELLGLATAAARSATAAVATASGTLPPSTPPRGDGAETAGAPPRAGGAEDASPVTDALAAPLDACKAALAGALNRQLAAQRHVYSVAPMPVAFAQLGQPQPRRVTAAQLERLAADMRLPLDVGAAVAAAAGAAAAAAPPVVASPLVLPPEALASPFDLAVTAVANLAGPPPASGRPRPGEGRERGGFFMDGCVGLAWLLLFAAAVALVGVVC
jgi:hypothetical protein